MSSSEASIVYNDLPKLGPELKDLNGSRIYYEKPSIDQIRKNGNPLNLKISDVKGETITIDCYVENLEKASKGIYYGPFPILVSGRTSKIKCYFPEKWCAIIFGSDGIPKTFQKYIVPESASRCCDLSLAPTRQLTDSEPSSTSNSESQGSTLLDPNFGNISVSTSNPNMLFGRNTYRYVKPLEKDMKKCPSDKAFPLQFSGNDDSYIIVPCFTPESQNFPVGSDQSDVYTIQLIHPNGSVPLMKCHIPHVKYLLDTQNEWEKWLRHKTSKNGSEMTPNYLGRCDYTIYKKDMTKVKKSFTYIIPSQNDIENGKNHFELQILNGIKLTRVRLYIGDISSFVRKNYIGPYMIEENKTDGTRGWLNCYFEKGSIYHLNEDPIHHRVQELFLKKDEYESQKNVFLGTDEPRSDTEVKCFEKNGVRSFHVFRTIEEHDMTRDDSSRSEI